jgi:3-demethoxyubiquinol 3-hydroxylase
MRKLSALDRLLVGLNQQAAMVAGVTPSISMATFPLGEVQTVEDIQHAAGLMRVNHVGEVCAQALYAAQALATTDPVLQAHFQEAGREEANHLAWTAQRLNELGARPSYLNPLWALPAGPGMPLV